MWMDACVGMHADGGPMCGTRPTLVSDLGRVKYPSHSSFGLTGPRGCLCIRESNQCPILKKKNNPKTNQFAAIQIKAISCGFPTGDSWGFFLTRLPGN